MSALPQYGHRLDAAATMRAVVIDRYGPPDELRLAQVPRPRPGRGQVLVRSRFVGVNPKDLMVRKGKFRLLTGRRFPLIVGHDIAGEVVEAAPGSDLAPGALVFGMINDLAGRAYAEYAAVDADQLALAPASTGLDEAAAVPLAAQTALQALRDVAGITAGQSVLINGASGGVGLFAVQIARILGAEVTAVCSHRNLDLVRQMGAHHTIDYGQTDLPRLGARFDVFFDVFGNYRFAQARRLLQPRGRYIQTIPGARILLDGLLSLGHGQRAQLVVVRSRRAQLDWLRGQIDAGQLRAVIDRSYPLSEAAEAHRYLATKRARGKVVLAVD